MMINMKKKLLFIFIGLLIFYSVQAQQAIGSWQAHTSYHHVTRSEPAGERVYAVGNGSLYSYDKEDTSVRTYEKWNPLSDSDISSITYAPAYKSLIIVYANSNIDLFVNDEEVYNLPDYMNKNMTQSKEVHGIFIADEYAYLSTSFGVVVVNIKKKEITNAYVLNKIVYASVVEGNRIYSATDQGLFTGLLTDNLLDINNWKKVSNTVFSFLTIYNGELIGNIIPDGIYVINKTDYSYSQLVPGHYTYLYLYADKLLAGNSNSLYLFDSINKGHYMDHAKNIVHLSYSNGTYWASCEEKGLIGLTYNQESNQLEELLSSIVPNSPIKNWPYYMAFANERLLVTGGSHSKEGNRLEREGIIMILDGHTWTNFKTDNISEQTKLSFQDITSIAQDPSDPNHHFASSAGEGLYEFQNNEFVKLYSLNNSPLESTLTPPSEHYVRINGLRYDKKENLWMLSNSENYKVHVLKKNGEWINYKFPEIGSTNNFQHTLFDKRGWLWGISSFYASYGVFCLNTNGTLENTSDDQHRFIKQFTNQDGIVLDHQGIYCIAEDKEGVIWIGTEKGPIVLNSPTRFFEKNFYCTQIKVPRNDGTNLADFLLENEIINAIAVDGANRKWIGTEASGIYLLSADGMETIHHFTSENSPLLANSISDIAIHPRTGAVYIGTGKGITTYQSDATEAGETFSEDIHAYPNPVKPDYNGVITVTGMVRDSDVRITNVTGKLIYAGTSVGGQFIWNGRNQQGQRVSSGIYFVLAANAEGKEGIATKILFIK